MPSSSEPHDDERKVCDGDNATPANAGKPEDDATRVEPGEKDGPTTVVPMGTDERTCVDPVDTRDRTVVEPQPQPQPDADATLPPDDHSQRDQTVFENSPEEKTVVEANSPQCQSPAEDNNTPRINKPSPPVSSDDVATIATNVSSDDVETLNTLLSGGASSAGAGSSPGVRYLERFELIRVLGQGAFGTVYLAQDPRLDRQVAIKVAKTGVLNSQVDIDRFNREAKAAAALRHPNIVPVYEVGQSKGSTYIVYEFVEGRTLKGLMKERGKLPPEEAVELMTTLARALDYAHASGIIHRDLKPDNILIDSSGQPHIADFGLARNEEKDATRTREGTLMGTPAYMSPEQASGQVSKVDRRSDVWSLGIMLDEMLTARRIFSGTVVEVLTAVQTQAVKPIRSADETLPIDLETICLKALEKNQEQRFQTAGELADELTLWSNGEPITIRRISVLERAYRWAKRNQTVAALLATVFVTLATGATVSAWFGFDANRKADALRDANRARVAGQLQTVLAAEPEAVPTLLDELAEYKNDKDLLELVRGVQRAPGERPTRRPLLTLTLVNDTVARAAALKALSDAMLQVDVREFMVLREELFSEKDQLIAGLWLKLEDSNQNDELRLRAAAALALYDPDSTRWGKVSTSVVSQLLSDKLALPAWSRALRPVRTHLRKPLTVVFENKDPSASIALASMFHDSADTLLDFVRRAEPEQLGVLVRQLHHEATDVLAKELSETYSDEATSAERDQLDQQRANAALALLGIGQISKANAELSHRDRNGVRSYVIDRASDAGLSRNVLFKALRDEDDPRVLRTAILAMANYDEAGIGQQVRVTRSKDLIRLYRNHPDSGVHAAIDYVMRHWGLATEIESVSKELQSPDWPMDGRRWHHSESGIAFAIFRDPPEFWMGTDDPIRGEPIPREETRHRRKIKRSFAISLREITIGQYRQLVKDYRVRNRQTGDRHPANFVSWYDAAKYCNLLSAAENVPGPQRCYLQSDGKLRAPADVVDRLGYRMPTSAEWEYAARGGTETLRHFGSGTSLLSAYAWTGESALKHPNEVGQLFPNQFGLFDALGNVHEWCQTWHIPDESPAGTSIVDGDEATGRSFIARDYRGGSYLDLPSGMIEAARFDYAGVMINKFPFLGFRIARTLPDEGSDNFRPVRNP